jgi:hypothetical protein
VVPQTRKPCVSRTRWTGRLPLRPRFERRVQSALPPILRSVDVLLDPALEEISNSVTVPLEHHLVGVAG